MVDEVLRVDERADVVEGLDLEMDEAGRDEAEHVGRDLGGRDAETAQVLLVGEKLVEDRLVGRGVEELELLDGGAAGERGSARVRVDSRSGRCDALADEAKDLDGSSRSPQRPRRSARRVQVSSRSQAERGGAQTHSLEGNSLSK
jgi:hypothetical protein